MSKRTDIDRKLSAKLRSLPSVDRVLQSVALSDALERWPRDQIVAAVRVELETARTAILDGGRSACEPDDLACRAERALDDQLRPSLRHVVNATGVVIHTNLGRAPVSDAAQAAMGRTAGAYGNIEFDLESGERGSRAHHLEPLLQTLCGAEAAVAVNNNAAALYLAINAHCAVREVIVSRGQAVEIGGGFRIPDVLRQAGAELVEVGATNRTRASDYADAINERTAAILRVHSSNFRIVGFTEEPSLTELRQVADDAGALLIDDVGSGCLLDTRNFGLTYEPRPQDSVEAGADLVMFSGDKLLGGPQAGLIVGRRSAVEPLRSHPLMRALRLDKAAIAGLAATLRHYLLGEAESAVPIWRMIALDEADLRPRAEHWRDELGVGEVEPSESPIGGGSLPTETRPTAVWALQHDKPELIARRLRERETPVIGRIERDRLLLDPRTVLADEDQLVIAALRDALPTPQADA